MATVIAQSTSSRLEGAPRPLLRGLSDRFSYLFPDSAYTRASAGGWDGRLRPFHAGTGRFPTGLLPRVCQHLRDAGEEFRFVDGRPSLDGDARPVPFDADLRDYQQAFVGDVERYRWGVLHAVPRAGKTHAAMATLARLGGWPACWICERVGLARQTADVAARLLPGVACGVVGDGDCDLSGDLTICTVQSLAAAVRGAHADDSDYAERPLTAEQHEAIRGWLPNVRVVVVDEAHHVLGDGARCKDGQRPSYHAVLDLCTGASHRLGLSGKIGRASCRERV